VSEERAGGYDSSAVTNYYVMKRNATVQITLQSRQSDVGKTYHLGIGNNQRYSSVSSKQYGNMTQGLHNFTYFSASKVHSVCSVRLLEKKDSSPVPNSMSCTTSPGACKQSEGHCLCVCDQQNQSSTAWLLLRHSRGKVQVHMMIKNYTNL